MKPSEWVVAAIAAGVRVFKSHSEESAILMSALLGTVQGMPAGARRANPQAGAMKKQTRPELLMECAVCNGYGGDDEGSQWLECEACDGIGWALTTYGARVLRLWLDEELGEGVVKIAHERGAAAIDAHAEKMVAKERERCLACGREALDWKDWARMIESGKWPPEDDCG